MADVNPKPQGWTRWVFVASLALNLIVAGVVAGAFLKGGPDGPSSRFDLTAGPLTRAMSPEDRDELRDALRESGAFRQGSREAIRADMQAMLDVLKAETFDRAAFLEALSRQRARLQAGQNAVLEAITQQIEGMSPQARTELADRLQEQLRRGPPSRDR